MSVTIEDRLRGIVSSALHAKIQARTGREPVGKARAKLIRNLQINGMATSTIKLANKEYRLDRVADELLAVFAALSPIVTGRDCFLFTADEDVLEQTFRMSQILFDDYGAFLIANDFRANESRYNHRHQHNSPLFTGDAEALGRSANPDYLLPPASIINTCATVVVDVNKLQGFRWIAARNMEAAVAFQGGDPMARKGDPGTGRSILFTLPQMSGGPARSICKEKFHFVIGTPSYLKISDGSWGPIPVFDLVRATHENIEATTRRQRILTPFSAHQQHLRERATTVLQRK